MNQLIKTREAATDPLRDLYAPIKDELADIERILRTELRNRHPFIDEMVRYGCLLGGKRLRPALLLLAAKATGEVNQSHLVLGAVVEMIHTATLVHDDVLDEADQRRHLATVNARWDNEASVLLGDYLFTHAFYLASTLETTMACRLIGRATNTVCEGELKQIASRGNFALDETEYLEVIEGKTASLCSCACRLGALYSGAPADVVERLASYGRNIGIAFQIADDLLDLLGDERTTGKSLGTDLQKQKPTLPLIRTLELADDADRDELLTMLATETVDVKDLLPWFERYDALQYTRDRAAWFAEQARVDLGILDPSPALEVLRQITAFVVARSS